MTYEQWDKISPVNGKDAADLIGQEQMENDDPFVLFYESGTVIAIESVSTMKSVYGLTGATADEVATAYIAFKAVEVVPLTAEERIAQLESENAQLAARMRSAEYAASENSATAQGLLELLIDMEVI